MCVSLALSIAVYLAHKDAHKLFGLNSKDKTVLLEMSTVRESYDIPLTKQAEYIEAIDNLMSWCDRNKKVRVSEVLVYEGIAKVNFMFEQENLKCHIHLLDLF